jgi:hypothetical protein
MKTPLCSLVCAVALSVAAAAVAANVPGLDVTVKQDGKAVYKGKTDANGSVTTSQLAPGSYNVEFRAPKSMPMHSQQLSISVKAKGVSRQTSAEGKYMQSGVAVTVDVPRAAALTAQVKSAASTSTSAVVSGAAPAGMERVKANVKMINGKRHVWVPGPVGSQIPGKWVEEGTEGAIIPNSNRKGADTQMMQRIQDQSSNVGQR